MRIAVRRHRLAFTLIAFVRSAFSLIELVLMVRIILDFLRASADALFVSAIHRLTDPLLFPFIGTFPPYELQDGFVIQTHAVLALVVYAFVGYLIVQGISALSAHETLWRRNKIQ